MSEETFDPQVDDVIRQYLERQAGSVDARRVLGSVRARLALRSAASSSGRPLRRQWRWLVAAAVLLALGIWAMVGGRADAEDWVRQAREVHGQSVDRCYRVRAEIEGGRLEALPLWQQETRLWTRGNEFWIESASPSRKWAWGQDRQGRVWAAPGRQRAVRFDAGHIPEPLALACAIRGLQMETLLGEVLADFDLRWDESALAEPGTRRVRATLKPQHVLPSLRAVSLEIDQRSHVIRQAIVEREFLAGVRSAVTFRLIETTPQPENAYQLEGHVDPGAMVASNPVSWRALLLSWRHAAP